MRLFTISLFVILGQFFVIKAYAQETMSTSPKPILSVDLSIESDGNSNAIAVGLSRLHPVALKKKFSVGYGLRVTGFYGQDNGYVTAPANVSEGNFFKKQNETKLDTLYMSHSSVIAVNAAIYLHYQLFPKLGLQFNIDGVGLSLGADRNGRFESTSLGNTPSVESASVTRYNMLLTGDYDWGSLNSELSVKYSLNDRFTVNAGLSFLFTEYTTNNKLAFNNDRFRKKSLMPMVGVGYVF